MDRKTLLHIAIALLVLYNGAQIFLLVTAHPSAPSGPARRLDDTTHAVVQINVLNGCGVNGVGTVMTTFCRKNGYDVVEMGNYKNFDVPHTLVIDRSANGTDAEHLADLLGVNAKNVIRQYSNDQLVTASVVIGKDYPNLIPWKK